jgi:hypothetical protein
LAVEVQRGSKVAFLHEHLINTYQKYNINKFILTNADNEKVMKADDVLEGRDQRIHFKVPRVATVSFGGEKHMV